MLARVAQDLRVGGVIGAFDCDYGLPKLRIFVAQIGGEFLLGLRRANHQDFVRTAQGLGDIIEKMMIGRRFVTAVRALAAVDLLVLIRGMHHLLFLFRRREMPGGCFLVIYPNDSVVV
jgi:hypothetical protein